MHMQQERHASISFDSETTLTNISAVFKKGNLLDVTLLHPSVAQCVLLAHGDKGAWQLSVQ